MIDARVQTVLDMWHKHFKEEENQYIEFEPSDIEYFVGCLLYNHFQFQKALDTMKTIDLSYDFLQSCGDKEYEKAMQLIKSIEIEDEEEKMEFLQNYLQEVMQKYSDDELYLLKRLNYHVAGVVHRYRENIEVQKVEFHKPTTKNKNPLLR